MSEPKICPHHVLRLKRPTDQYDHDLRYVCGSCAALFSVKELIDDPTPKTKEPMFDRRPPWGFRDRQA